MALSEEALSGRIAQLHQTAPDSIGDLLRFSLISCGGTECVLRCRTAQWMRNGAGTLHGGMGAAILDQAMGFAAFCLMDGTTPTVQMQVNYHRPLIPGEDAVVKIQVVAQTRHLVSLRSEAALASAPERICLSATALYFHNPAEEK